jgi:hypothetical protein
VRGAASGSVASCHKIGAGRLVEKIGSSKKVQKTSSEVQIVIV